MHQVIPAASIPLLHSRLVAWFVLTFLNVETTGNVANCTGLCVATEAYNPNRASVHSFSLLLFVCLLWNGDNTGGLPECSFFLWKIVALGVAAPGLLG